MLACQFWFTIHRNGKDASITRCDKRKAANGNHDWYNKVPILSGSFPQDIHETSTNDPQYTSNTYQDLIVNLFRRQVKDDHHAYKNNHRGGSQDTRRFDRTPSQSMMRGRSESCFDSIKKQFWFFCCSCSCFVRFDSKYEWHAVCVGWHREEGYSGTFTRGVWCGEQGAIKRRIQDTAAQMSQFVDEKSHSNTQSTNKTN
jgi:hypothetical protein